MAPYVPRKPYSGPRPKLPTVPKLPVRPLKVGDAYTVWGASYSLRHSSLRATVDGKSIRIRGVIGKTNLPTAPLCAVHPPGRADPEGCRAPVPTLWLCDRMGDRPEDCIQVQGWASNYAQIYGAMREYRLRRGARYVDSYWGIEIPNPLPARGAEVTVTGRYSQTFTGASTGVSSDPIMGIVTYEQMQTHRPAPRRASLPK